MGSGSNLVAPTDAVQRWLGGRLPLAVLQTYFASLLAGGWGAGLLTGGAENFLWMAKS